MPRHAPARRLDRERAEDAVRSALPRLPEVERVEPARRHASGRRQLGRDRPLDRRERQRPRGLRLRALGRGADRDPDHGRRQEAEEDSRLLRVRRRVRPRPVPDPAQRQDRGRPLLDGRPARDHRRPLRVPPLRALLPVPEGRRLEGGLGRDLEPALEQAAPRGLDVGRRGRAPDLPRPRALRRGQARRDRPRASLHRPAHAPRIRLPGSALRERLERREPAADGPAPAAEGELRRERLPAPGADRARRAQALRDDRRRQRVELVHHRRARCSVVERPAAHAGPRERLRLRGRAEGRYESRSTSSAVL